MTNVCQIITKVSITLRYLGSEDSESDQLKKQSLSKLGSSVGYRLFRHNFNALETLQVGVSIFLMHYLINSSHVLFILLKCFEK